jgi:hypothetical protein
VNGIKQQNNLNQATIPNVNLSGSVGGQKHADLTIHIFIGRSTLTKNRMQKYPKLNVETNQKYNVKFAILCSKQERN